jgi:predicted DCC family thiol-disulfide oxidoreductase YuxK
MDSARYDEKASATLLYDEDCGLCRATAAWLGRRVAPSTLRLLPLSEAANDSAIAPTVAGRDLKAMLHLVDREGRVFIGARAVVAAGRLVPRWRRLAAAVDHRVGYAFLDPVYRLISSRRRQVSRLLGLPPSCPVPLPAERPGSMSRGGGAING